MSYHVCNTTPSWLKKFCGNLDAEGVNQPIIIHVQEGGKAWTTTSLEIGDCIEPHRTGVWAGSILELWWIFKVLYLTKPRGEDSYSELAGACGG